MTTGDGEDGLFQRDKYMWGRGGRSTREILGKGGGRWRSRRIVITLYRNPIVEPPVQFLWSYTHEQLLQDNTFEEIHI
jgi:hypothetical protein